MSRKALKEGRQWYILGILLVGLMTVYAVSPRTASAADEENCLMCHKHRGIGRIDLRGKRRIFHVNEELFAKSVHGRVPCRGCHVGISQIPHKVVVQKVDCGVQCHKKEPSTGRDFSHRSVYRNYKRSVHGTDLKNPEPGKPVCKYCHQNPLYTRTAKGREKPIQRILARCQACHTEKEWAHTFYMHVEHRLMKRTFRGRKQVVELCASCHANKALMRSKGLSKKAINAVDTYRMTYHWKALELGRTDTADCIDCHTYYEPYSPDNVHLILRPSDPESSVHPDNKGKICAQDYCHDGKNAAGPPAPPEMAELDLHMDFEDPENPVEFIVSQAFFVLTFGTLMFCFVWMFLELLRKLF